MGIVNRFFAARPRFPPGGLIFTRHSGNSPVIPAIHHPSFRQSTTRHSGSVPRHSGESRNLAPPLYSALPRGNGQPAKPPEKSAIFSDATHLQSVHQCGILLTASPATRPRGSNVTPKAGPAAQVHGDRNPPDRVSSPKAKASGEKSGNHKNRVQDNTAQTVGIATIVGSGTHSALFHGGVSGHAAGVPTALCRSSNGPGHGKLGHEICKQNSPGRSSDSLNPTAQPPMPSPPSTINHQPSTANQSPTTNRQPPPSNKEHRQMGTVAHHLAQARHSLHHARDPTAHAVGRAGRRSGASRSLSETPGFRLAPE